MDQTIVTPIETEAVPPFLTLYELIVAPAQAFERLRKTPIWLLAFLTAVTLSLFAQYLMTPARTHATVGTIQQQFQTNPTLQRISEPERARLISRIEHPSSLEKIFQLFVLPVTQLLGVLCETALLLLVNLFGGSATFKRLWSLAMHIAAVQAVGAVVLGVITLFRGAEDFKTAADITAAMPGLAYIAPHATGFLAAFLAGINVFSIWSACLMGFGLIIVARAPKNASIFLATAVLFSSAGLPALLVGLSH